MTIPSSGVLTRKCNGIKPAVTMEPIGSISSQALISLYTLTAALSFVYVFSYNFVPITVQQVLAGLLAIIGLLTFSVGLEQGRQSRPAKVMVLVAALMAAIATATLIAYRELPDAIHIARNFTGIFLIAWALMQRFSDRRFERFLTHLGLFAIALCILMPVFNDPILRGGTLRMGSITSGNESLHPSAYLSVVAFFWVMAMGYYKRKLALALPIAATIVVIVYLYAADAASVILLFLVGSTLISLFLQRRLNVYLTYLVPIAFILAAVTFFVVLQVTQESWDIYMGSGRIGAWLDRFQRLASRDLIQLLFGEGPGSDNYYGSLTWTGKATHSHNDFLNVALELGIVGLIAYVCLMVSMVITAPVYLRYFVTMVIIAPFLSGGILFKPTVAPIMALVILHTRMMHDAAAARRGGRPYRPPLFSAGRQRASTTRYAH